MTALPDIHICIQQPAGYVHSLGFLDQARYFRYQFRRLGARVSIARNRLRHDAVNFVFGAHLGFDAAQRERHACIVVNLEQLGEGGARVSSDYVRLLDTSAVADYDALNLPAYAPRAGGVPVVPLLYAPYLAPAHGIALEERPIDLLFIGSVNPRRQAWIERIEACGVAVAQFDGPLYGAERDAFIVQAKAVLNTPYYEASRFEQARASHCLSLGTPVISERAAQYRPHPAFEDSVHWLAGEDLERFFTHDFGSPAFYASARAALERFRQADPIDAYARLLAFAAAFGREHKAQGPQPAWQPRRIHLGAGADYQGGWLNVDLDEAAEPDLVLDLAAPLALPLSTGGRATGPVLLAENSVEVIHAVNVLQRVPDLASLMGNCLRLLEEGGLFQIEVPYEHAPSAWADPATVRAMNEQSWRCYTDRFWSLGWFAHRFEIGHFNYLDEELKDCEAGQAAHMRVILRKVPTTLRERTTARTMGAGLHLPEDEVAPEDRLA